MHRPPSTPSSEVPSQRGPAAAVFLELVADGQIPGSDADAKWSVQALGDDTASSSEPRSPYQSWRFPLRFMYGQRIYIGWSPTVVHDTRQTWT